MESVTDNTPLIVLLGPTASGKTTLSLQLAQQFDGEIIAADSRTIYRNMDLGTAKPTKAEQRLVPHHLLDILDPDQPFSVARFQDLAGQAIADIAGRGKLPMLVGGSGLYIDSVIYGFTFRGAADPQLRAELEDLPVDELQQRLAERSIPLPANDRNPRHLVRALETGGELPSRQPLRPNTLVIGLSVEKEQLEANIRERADAGLRAGLVDEARGLAGQYGWDAPGLQAPAYQAVRTYLEGGASLDEAREQLIRSELQYTKRQKTWFKRDPNISWISKPEEAVELVTTFLNK